MIPDTFSNDPQAITDAEFRQHAVRLSRDIAEIKCALMGDAYGNPGLIPRITAAEKQLENHDRKLLAWGAAIYVAGIVMVFLKDFLLA